MFWLAISVLFVTYAVASFAYRSFILPKLRYRLQGKLTHYEGILRERHTENPGRFDENEYEALLKMIGAVSSHIDKVSIWRIRPNDEDRAGGALEALMESSNPDIRATTQRLVLVFVQAICANNANLLLIASTTIILPATVGAYVVSNFKAIMHRTAAGIENMSSSKLTYS